MLLGMCLVRFLPVRDNKGLSSDFPVHLRHCSTPFMVLAHMPGPSATPSSVAPRVDPGKDPAAGARTGLYFDHQFFGHELGTETRLQTCSTAKPHTTPSTDPEQNLQVLTTKVPVSGVSQLCGRATSHTEQACMKPSWCSRTPGLSLSLCLGLRAEGGGWTQPRMPIKSGFRV